jgi:hypothetical protein
MIFDGEKFKKSGDFKRFFNREYTKKKKIRKSKVKQLIVIKVQSDFEIWKEIENVF